MADDMNEGDGHHMPQHQAVTRQTRGDDADGAETSSSDRKARMDSTLTQARPPFDIKQCSW